MNHNRLSRLNNFLDRLQEVSCGDVKRDGIKVVVPPDLSALVLARLDGLSDEHERALHGFLAYRCDRPFLAEYCKRNPGFIDGLRIWSYFYAISDVSVLVRLHEFGLLPEAKRRYVVERVQDLAVSTPDAGFVNLGIRSLLTEEEYSATLDKVRTELLPDLESTVDSWHDNYNGEDEPEAYFSELDQALTQYREAFADDPESLRRIDSALRYIEATIDELNLDRPNTDHDDDGWRTGTEVESTSGRSIFDDVDS